MTTRSPLHAVFFTIVIDLLGFGLILPLLPLYADRYGASKGMIGLILASFSAVQLVCAPLWGRLSDRIGRRPVILVGLAGSVASYLVFALAELPDSSSTRLTLLFASRIAAGLFGGTITAALATIADVTDVLQRGRGMAMVGAAFGLGFLVGPTLGGLGQHYLGAMAPGLMAMTLSAAAMAFAWRRIPEPERHAPGTVHGLRLGALSHALARPHVGRILLLSFGTVLAFGFLESTLALLALDRFPGWNPKANGWLFSYVGLWLVLAQGWLVRRYLPKVGERRFILAGALALAAGLIAVAYVRQPLVLGLLAPVAVIGSAMVTPSLASLLSQTTDAASQGEILGLNQSVQSLGRIASHGAGPALLGLGATIPYWAGAAVMVFAFLLGVRLPRR